MNRSNQSMLFSPSLLQLAVVNFDTFFFLPVKKFQSQSSGQYFCVSVPLHEAYAVYSTRLIAIGLLPALDCSDPCL